MNKLKVALPKGSLQESTVSLFKKAGINIFSSLRSYFPLSDDQHLDFMFIRAQEIGKYVDSGYFDVGITGYDWITETNADVVDVAELIYSKTGFRTVRWVLAVPEHSNIYSIQDLQGKTIATEAVNIVKNFFKKEGVDAQIEFSWGATEAKAGRLVDAIVELTETGASLRANRLRVLQEILTSTTRLIANKNSLKDPWKQQKTHNIAVLLKGALLADSRVGVKMNVHRNVKEQVIDCISTHALRHPTISPLSEHDWYAIEVVVPKKMIKDFLPELSNLGAEGMVEYPLNKVII